MQAGDTGKSDPHESSSHEATPTTVQGARKRRAVPFLVAGIVSGAVVVVALTALIVFGLLIAR